MVEAFYNLINLIGSTISETIKFLLDLKVCIVETFYNLRYLIDNIISKNISFLLSFDIKDYFKTSIIDEVAIPSAIGSLTFSIMIIIFLIQNFSNNEEYRYSNHSVAIYDFCNIKFIIIVNCLIIFDILLIDLWLKSCNIVYLIFLIKLYLLLLINICYYIYIFIRSKKILAGAGKWLKFNQNYNWEIINNLIKYHNKIVNETPSNEKNVQEQINELFNENKNIIFVRNKLYNKKDDIFILYGEKNGILKNVDIKKLKKI